MRAPDAPADLAIIGAGAGAVALLHHLARRGFCDRRVIVLDPAADWPAGTAYAQARREHLLNAPARCMSLDARDAGDFARWAGAGRNIFLPRPSYAHYLRDRLDRALTRLAAAGVRVERRCAQVRAVNPGPGAWRLSLEGEAPVFARQAALAIGPAPRPPLAPPGPSYAPEPWGVDYAKLVRGRGMGRAAAVIGTGLSAADAALSLAAAGWRGPILLVGASPPPRAHASWPNPPLALLRGLTPTLWRATPPEARKRLLRRWARRWSRLRYPMAPEAAQALQALARKGALRRVPARVEHAEAHPDGVLLRLSDGAALEAALAVEARGHDPTFAADPLVKALLDEGIARMSQTGWGLVPAPDLAVARRPWGAIHALGALLQGERLESLSMAAIRAQADRIARALISRA